jgi:hypothetical protein
MALSFSGAALGFLTHHLSKNTVPPIQITRLLMLRFESISCTEQVIITIDPHMSELPLSNDHLYADLMMPNYFPPEQPTPEVGGYMVRQNKCLIF